MAAVTSMGLNKVTVTVGVLALAFSSYLVTFKFLQHIFPKGNPMPSVKALTFYRSGTLTIDVLYADVSELQAPAKISTYTIGPFPSTKGEHAKLKVKVRLNLHGIVSIESATLLEEEAEAPAVKGQEKDATKMDTDQASSDLKPAGADGSDVSMHNASGVENSVPAKHMQMETDAKEFLGSGADRFPVGNVSFFLFFSGHVTGSVIASLDMRRKRWEMAWFFDLLNIVQVVRLLGTRSGHYTIDLAVGWGAGLLFDSHGGKHVESKTKITAVELDPHKG